MGNPAPTCPIDWGSVAQWVGGFATFLAVLVALFKESFLRKFRRPKLSVRIILSPPDSIKEIWRYRLPSQSPVKETTRYMFRLWVSNQGKYDRAEKVQVFAKKLEKLSADERTFVQVKEFLPMNLVWSNTRETFLEGISPHAMGKHCDLGHIMNPVALADLEEEQRTNVPQGRTIFALELEFRPLTKIHLLSPGTYRLHLIIAGVNALPVLKTLEIAITGNWYDDQETMLRDGVQIRILD
jgi:hypothetical protein